MKAMLDAIEVELASMTWEKRTSVPCLQEMENYVGQGKKWTVVVTYYRSQVDGAATCSSEGIVMHLTPDLAQQALKMARAT